MNPPRLTRNKRLAFNVLMVIGMGALIEAVSFALLVINYGTLEQIATERRKMAVQDPFLPGGLFYTFPTMIHPYFGSVLQPKKDEGELSQDNHLRITEFGFIDDDLPIHKRSSERVIVGILGGSVARQMSGNATDVLADELAKCPQFAGRGFTFVRLASDGYKQPQQLMIVNYLLALGAEFDVLINLDGFNEAVLPVTENIPYDMAAAYPRDWSAMVVSKTSAEFTRMAGYACHLRVTQRDEARFASAIPWCYSPTANLIWQYRVNRLRQTLVGHLENMTRVAQNGATYCSSGPPQHFESTNEIYAYCINLWSRSSMILHQLCRAKGIRYFQFLQPNQYFAGSKPIGSEEAAVSIENDHPAKVIVSDCYPLMQVEGSRLAEAGVAFTDLTGVFADHHEPIYSDKCCHVRKSGDLIMAKAIGERITQLIRDE